MIGEKLGNYTVIERLGAGGMGEVFVAEHEVLHSRVAIKKLLPELSQNREVVARFFNEAKAATRIDHPGIVTVSDTGYCADGSAYFIMELLKGESLAARIRWRKVLPPADVARIGRQAAGVLTRAHAAGIVHRDLKPDNLFLVPDPDVVGGERVKVLDFGIAKLAENHHAVSVQTRFGSIMGTPFYMSPEQCRSAGDVDARADVYSLGCILFEMACGRPPFVSGDSNDILQAQKNTAPPSPRGLNQEVPAALDRLILRMLAKAPEKRPADMAEVARELEGVGGVPSARRSAVRAPTAETELELPAGPRTTLGGAAGEAVRTAGASRRVTWIVAGAVFVAGAAAAAVYLGRRGSHDPAPSIAATTQPAPLRAADPPLATVRPDAATAAAPAAPEPQNRWVLVASPPPGARRVLGVPRNTPAEVSGFRPQRAVSPPAEPYLLQAHEVTWGELEPWLAEHDGQRAGVHAPAWLADQAADKRLSLPATGIAWWVAQAYCLELGGSLPSEAQWEYAARGPELAPYPWGAAPLDSAGSNAYAGGHVVPVMTMAQDRTPGAPDQRLYDLAGNAQEWTAEVWTDDMPGPRKKWAEPFRAVRGLPPGDARPSAPETVAHREPLCAVGECDQGVLARLASIGFRCARPAR